MGTDQPGNVRLDIESARLLNEDVYHVLLRCESADRPAFFAGQYLLAQPAGGVPSAFSIASTPSAWQQDARLELHFRVQPHNPGSDAFRRAVTAGGTLDASLPHGNCHVGETPQRDVLLVAGSTGFAQIQSIAEHLLQQGFPHDLHVYWGGRYAADLYLHARAAQWAADHVNVTFHPVLSAVHEAPAEEMRDGWLHQAILEDFTDLGSFEVYVSGSPGMVYSVYDSLLPHGASRERFHSDVFDYAPRQQDR